MTDWPTGTVTFLFTDIEGSTRLWEEHPDAMPAALARHDTILRDVVERHGGHVVKTTGDGVLAAFSRAPQAVEAAVDGQRSLERAPWSVTGPLRVRMAVHTGEAELVDGDYHGPTLNRAARIMSAAHGGQVILSRVVEGLVADALPADVEIVDLGEGRLRDLSRPERLHQVVGPGWTTDVGSLRTLDAFPSNLPLEMTSFVGRDAEVTAIAAALADRRLVTVVGVGGVGKTRVALQVAAEIIPRFAHGAWICELGAAGDDDALVAVVASALGIKPRGGLPLDAAIQESLRDKQMLVVLDNCEHLLRAAGALAEGLLQRCPGVCVLATSREALAVAGEQVWPLRSLTVPHDAADVPAVLAAHAVELFVDRARSARPDFTLDATNVASVADICRRLDGIPLAIELAAARVSAMSPDDIAQLLDERFRLLTGGRRTAVERHQTLRATVDWSYSLLGPAERLVFDRLGVFPGAFDAASAAAVVAGDGVEEWDVREALMALVAKSLVAADADPEGGTRYQLLETLRQYARERLEELEGADAWRRSHARHFAALAEAAGPALLGADEVPWRRRVGAELDNLRAAVTWALDSEDPADGELAVRIIAALAFEATMRRTSGVAGWAEKALDRLSGTTPGRRAAVLACAGFGRSMRGDLAAAAALATAALEEEITADFPVANLPVVLQCNTRAHTGDPRGALDLAMHYAVVFDERGVRLFDRCNLHTVAAIWAVLSDDDAAARREVEHALQLAEQTGNPSSMAIASFVQGWVLEGERPDEALEHFDRSVDLTRSGASDVVLATALAHGAKIRAAHGERLPALRALRESMLHSHDDGDLPNVSGDLARGVTVLTALGEVRAAAMLAGWVEAGPLAAMVVVGPLERIDLDEAVARLRAELGDETYDRDFRSGAALSYADAIDRFRQLLDDAIRRG